jgi:hypothetical protein
MEYLRLFSSFFALVVVVVDVDVALVDFLADEADVVAAALAESQVSALQIEHADLVFSAPQAGMGQSGLLPLRHLHRLRSCPSPPSRLVHLPLQKLVLVPSAEELLVALQVLFETLFLPGSDDFKQRFGRGFGRRSSGGMEFNEVVEVVEGHVKGAFEGVVGEEAKGNEFLPHLLLMVFEEVNFGNDGQVLALLDLLGNELALGGLQRLLLLVWLDALPLHERHELRRNLSKGLTGQLGLSHRIPLFVEVPLEVDEVHHVPFAHLPRPFRFEQFPVLVQLLQLREVAIAEPDRHDGEGELGGLDDLIDGECEVVEAAVSEDDQHVVVGGLILCLCELDGHVDDVRQLGGPVRLDAPQSLLVKTHNFIDSASDQRVIVVAVEGKALSHALVVGREARSKAVERDLIVVVEVLQHAHYLANGQDVGVAVVIGVVQRLPPEVGVGEVDAQQQVQPRPVHDVGQKGIAVYLCPAQHSHVAHHEPILIDPLGKALLVLSEQQLQGEFLGGANFLVRVNVVEPDAQASGVLAGELVGGDFELVEVGLALDFDVVGPRHRQPLAVPQHLYRVVHLQLADEVQRLQLHLVLEVAAVVLAAAHLQHRLLLRSRVRQRQRQLGDLVVVEDLQLVTGSPHQGLLRQLLQGWPLAVVDSELDFVLPLGAGGQDEGSEELGVWVAADNLSAAQFDRLALDVLEDSHQSVHFVEALGGRECGEGEGEFEVGDVLLVLDGKGDVGCLDDVHVHLLLIAPYSLPLAQL